MESGDALFAFLSSQHAIARTFLIYQSRWLLFTKLALMAIIPQVALRIITRKALAVDASFLDMPGEIPFSLIEIEICSFCVFNTIIQAVIVQVVAEYYAHKVSTLKGSLSAISDRHQPLGEYIHLYTFQGYFLVAFCLYGLFLKGILIRAGSVVCAASLFRRLLKRTTELPVVMVEKQPAIDAINRSTQLLRVHYWYFIGSLSLFVVPVLLAVVIYSVALEKMLGISFLSIVLKGLPGIIFLPLRTILVTVLYLSIRVKAEDLNMEMLERELEVKSDDTKVVMM